MLVSSDATAVTTTATTTAGPTGAAPKPKRTKARRRIAQHTPAPSRAVTIGRRAYVAVPLSGSLGAGLEMILDAASWRRVRHIAPAWLLVKRPQRAPFVGTFCQSIKFSGTGSHLDLARVIAKAADGQPVFHRNGCVLDLRLCNLVVIAPANLNLPAFKAA